MKKRRPVFLIIGLISAFLSLPPGLIAFVFLIIGFIYRANPSSVNITVNGVVQQGAQAVATALRLSGIFLTVGGISLGIALLFLFIFLIFLLLFLFFKKTVIPEQPINYYN